ncbi:MAG: thymidylate kinase [Candidatus Aenigmarchaeota archaeon]|nr:thymidylate kinase [Candidatus Aenigmarchaeota archaeon]
MRGKLIVLEGIDGSGKATQAHLLAQRLRQHGYRVRQADFPQYGRWSAAFVEKYLRGEWGTAQQVGPYAAAVCFAMDRLASRDQLRKWLGAGDIVVSNRYVSASLAHQGAKIPDLKERGRVVQWIKDLEYGKLGIPKPDVTILLKVPPEIGRLLVGKKPPRKHLRGKKRDIHEQDTAHLRAAEHAYMDLARSEGWQMVECVWSGRMLPPQTIAELVWDKVRPALPEPQAPRQRRRKVRLPGRRLLRRKRGEQQKAVLEGPAT